jgi:hypothetical protein
MREKKITPHLVWEKVKGQVEQTADGYLVFDDTVVDKNFLIKTGFGAAAMK